MKIRYCRACGATLEITKDLRRYDENTGIQHYRIIGNCPNIKKSWLERMFDDNHTMNAEYGYTKSDGTLLEYTQARSTD